jgi:dGTPase
LADITRSDTDWRRIPRVRVHGERWRAEYACDPALSRGRLFKEAESPLRSAFQRDRDRIIHSNAFRRLKHKTQVFIYHEGDHFRTRLTHSLEVAQIARSIARPLGLDEDLAEAIALAHDLGHPPFGHAGERTLDKALADFGGFDHNAQSLRVVTTLERRYPTFDGLNLTWETLEGLVKHNGPLTRGAAGSAEVRAGLPYAIAEYPAIDDLEIDGWPGLEAQAAAIADDIAYNSHDIEDGLRAGLLTLDGLRDAPLAGTLIGRIGTELPDLSTTRRVHELVRRLITVMIEDVIAETAGRLECNDINSIDAVRRHDGTLVTFSGQLAEVEAGLKSFLFANLYRNPVVQEQVDRAELVVGELFDRLLDEPGLMPPAWCHSLVSGDRQATARLVADYIAGMTDRFALSEHGRLFDGI